MIKGLLKGFFILGLTLLPISFSSAISQDYYSPFSITSRCLYEVDYNITNNGSFSSYYNGIQKNNILYFKGGTYSDCRGQQYIVFGRKNGKLYGFFRNDAGGVNQGYFNYYCYGAEPCGTMNVSSDTMINILNNQGVKGLYLSTPNASVFPDDGFNQSHQACFITNSQTVPYLCFYSGYPSNYSFSESLDYNVSDWDDLSSRDGFFDNSPVYVSPIPDYDFNEDDDFTNQQIIDGYNAMGLTDEFCYGGFALDNIFEAGTLPQMFTGYRWGGGASIFDIWDIYSGAYNNDYISFLRSFYISYENDNYSDFYGKTKALYGFVNQWFSVSSKGLGFIEATAPTFTLVDVWQYCDLRFNQNPDSVYTGSRWDPKFRYYTSGQVNLGGYFNFSGNNNYFSGNLSGFNTPKDFFASLNSIFQGGLNNLENREPVLPSYIIVFFLAIIFIRIISH